MIHKFRLYDHGNKEYYPRDFFVSQDGKTWYDTEGFRRLLGDKRWELEPCSPFTDKDGLDIYHNDIVELMDNTGKTVYALCEYGIAQRVFDSGFRCDIAGFYFDKKGFKSFPIIKNHKGKHDTKIMKVVGNFHHNQNLLKK